jgi:hypothetical protein
LTRVDIADGNRRNLHSDILRLLAGQDSQRHLAGQLSVRFEARESAADNSLSEIGFEDPIDRSRRCGGNLPCHIRRRVGASGTVAGDGEIKHNLVRRQLT